MKVKRDIEIRIPKELGNNYTVVIPKGGNAGKDNQGPGDLTVQLKIK